MSKIKEFLSGKKVYVLMAFGSIAAIVQYLGGIDLGVDGVPPVDSIGALVSQLWVFAAASGFRAAIGK